MKIGKTKMMINYRKILLNICYVSAVIFLFTACADKPFEELSGSEHNSKKTGIRTTTISITDATASVMLPQSETKTRASVTMNNMFKLTQDNDFQTDAYIIKADANEHINSDRLIGHLTIKWKHKQSSETGYKLSTNIPETEIHWINNNGGNISDGDWYICGVVGGTPEDNDRIAFGYPEGNVMGEPANNGNKKFNVPFVANWVKVKVNEKNKISFKGMVFEPQGVVFKVKIKRNEDIISAAEHKYTFASTALSANGYFSFRDKLISEISREDEIYDPRQKHDVKISHNTNPKDFWIWNFKSDENQLDDWRRKQTNSAALGANKTFLSIRSWEYRYRYTHTGSNNKGTEYDEFYVWGMPINGGIVTDFYTWKGDFNGKDGYKRKNQNHEFKNNLNNYTSITSAQGGFMLGWLGNDNKVKEEFIVGKTVTSEGKEIDERDWEVKYNGKVIDVNLKVMRPGDSRYKWRVPLSRMAKTNIKVANPGLFTGNVTPDKGDGNFKQQDNGDPNKISLATLCQHKKDLLPKDYHIPGTTELTAAFPYINKRFYADWQPYEDTRTLESYGYVSSTDKKMPSGQSSELNLNGNFSEYLRLGDEKKDAVLFNSIYKIVDHPISGQSKTKKVFYAIRFKHKWQKDDGTLDENANPVGNRYCCAYRYIIHTEDRNNDERGARVSITARWLGNLPISINEVATEEFWNQNNSLDVVRIFNRDGTLFKGHQKGITYASRTRRYARDKDEDPNEVAGSLTAFMRIVDTNGFYRQSDTGKGVNKIAIRCIADWKLKENAKHAPRNQNVDPVNGIPAEEYYK